MSRSRVERWKSRGFLVAVAVVGSAVSVGCGTSDDVPSADELVDLGVTGADLGPAWASTPDALPGVILNDERGDLATLDLCPDASDDAIATAADLRWQVGSGVGFAGADVAIPPALVVLLLADDPDAIRDTFDELREAMTSCLPTEVTLIDAGDFAVSELDVPDVGDDRFGIRRTQIDQPAGSDRWDERHVLVRDGAVLMWFSEIEVNPDTELVVDTATFDAALVAAANRLTGEPTGAATTTSDVGLANPASVFCVEQGGTVEIVDEAGGQVGYCVLPDGRRLDEWEFFRSSTSTTTQP